MSVIGELFAAVEKLTDIRDTCSLGEWTVTGPDPFCIVVAQNSHVAIDMYERDALAVATLHATIDAQLAILRNAVATWRAVEEEGSPEFLVRHVEGYMQNAELALARAINGKATA